MQWLALLLLTVLHTCGGHRSDGGSDPINISLSCNNTCVCTVRDNDTSSSSSSPLPSRPPCLPEGFDCRGAEGGCCTDLACIQISTQPDTDAARCVSCSNSGGPCGSFAGIGRIPCCGSDALFCSVGGICVPRLPSPLPSDLEGARMVANDGGVMVNGEWIKP